MTKVGYKHSEETKRKIAKARTKHGGWGTRLYSTWHHMLQRCFNENNKDYPRYGGRDIYVEDISWFDFVPFRDWALANGYQEGLSIDRIDNNEGYRPDNCQWIPRSENTKKRDRHYKPVEQYSLDGELLGYYYSIDQAERATGAGDSSISKVCKGKLRTAGGYYWAYAS